MLDGIILITLSKLLHDNAEREEDIPSALVNHILAISMLIIGLTSFILNVFVK